MSMTFRGKTTIRLSDGPIFAGIRLTEILEPEIRMDISGYDEDRL